MVACGREMPGVISFVCVHVIVVTRRLMANAIVVVVVSGWAPLLHVGVVAVNVGINM